MSNNSLLLPNIAAAPNDTDYDAVCAEIAATDRGRSFLTEYASRNRHADTHRLVGTIARLDAAMRGDPRPQIPASLARGLAELATAIQQIEAILLASGSSAADVHFAVDRVQDIAMALRQREVEAALCDTLEAAIREVGDAIVRDDAAATRARSAAALLRDLAHRVNDLIALVVTVTAPEAKPIDRPADVGIPSDPTAERFDDSAQKSASESIDGKAPEEVDARSPPQSVPVHPPMPDPQALAGPKEDPADLLGPVPLPVPSPMDGREEVARATDHEDKAGRGVFSTGAATSVDATSHTINGNTPPAPTHSPRLPVNEPSVAPTVRLAALYDPLAALRALSEEELIALFS